MWGIGKLSDLSVAMGNLGVIDLSSPNPSVEECPECPESSDDIFSSRPLPPLPPDADDYFSSSGFKLPKPFGAPADGRAALREVNSADRGGKVSAVEKTEKSAAASKSAASTAEVPQPRRTPRKRASTRPPANDEVTAPSVENQITSRKDVKKERIVPPVPPPSLSVAQAAVRPAEMPPNPSDAPTAVRPKPVPLFATPSPPLTAQPDPEVPCPNLHQNVAHPPSRTPETTFHHPEPYALFTGSSSTPWSR